MAYFSDKRMELEKLKSNTIGKLEILDEIENDFKRIIEKKIIDSKEYDGAGDVWVNAFDLLEALDLEEWNLKRNQKIVSGLDEIKKVNDVSKQEGVKE